MALSATFTANFSSFYDAVDKADVKLKDFGAGADKVGGRLTALGNSFTGVKLIQDATLMVKAVEDIGGASKLTEKELARLGATTNEAVAKMKALGMEVPKNLQEIADKTKAVTKATTDVTKATTDWKGALTTIAGTLGVSFGVSQIISFGKAIVQDAGHIADLSAKLGISAEAVQRFGYAASQTGASMDTIGSAIGKMNVTLAEGDKSTVAALDQIGLSFRDVRAMKPEDAFTAIAQAIQRIPDPMLQAEAAVKLFGKTGADLLPAINADLIEIGNSAKVMSDHTVEELDKAGDEWGRFVDDIKVSTAEFMVWAKENARKYAFGAAGFIAQEAAGLVKDTHDVVYGQSKIIADAAESLTTALGKVKDPLKAIGLAAKDTKGLLADYNVIAEQAKDKADALAASEKKAADVAEAHRQKIADLAATLSGVGLTQKVKDLDEATRLAVKTWGVGVLNSKELVAQVQALGKAGAALTPTLMEVYRNHLDLALGITETVDATKLLKAVGGDVAPILREQAAAAKELSDQYKEVAHATSGDANKLLGSLSGLNVKPGTPKPEVDEFAKAIHDLSGAFAQLAQMSDGVFSDIAKDIAVLVGAMDLAHVSTETFQKGLANLKPGTMTQGIGQMAAGAAGVVTAFQSATKETDKLHSTLNGAAIGFSVAGPWGAAVGAGIGLLKGFFNEAKRSKELTTLRDDFIRASGGLTALSAAAREAGGNLDAVLRARSADQLKKAIADLTAAFQYQQDALQLAMETAEKYGFTLEELGPAMARQKLDQQAQQLFKDWEVLNSAGLDTVLITEKMSQAVSEYVQQALKMGLEVPAAMRPMLEAMVKSGTLLDENGNAITDLKDAGITFALTMSEGFQRLIDEVEKLTLAITRGLHLAIKETPELNVPVRWSYPDGPPRGPVLQPDPGSGAPGAPGPGLQSYQGGTEGFVNFGRETPVLLHGWEAVVPRGHALTGGAPINITVVSELDGREVARNQVRYLPNALRVAGV